MRSLFHIGVIVAIHFGLVVISVGQSNVDLEVTVQLFSDSARGGEPFAFSAQVTNRGKVTATDVILLADPNHQLYVIKSAVPQKGTCEAGDETFDPKWRCRIGDMHADETITITFGGKLNEVDGDLGGNAPLPRDAPQIARDVAERRARMNEAVARMAEALAKTAGDNGLKIDEAGYRGTTLADVSAFADVADQNDEDNRADVRATILPSRNQPPQVFVTSPKADALLMRPARKSTSFKFIIEAFDPDGTVGRVLVLEPKDSIIPVPAEGYWKFLYHGKAYTAAELESFLKTNPQPKYPAVRMANNTFSYTLIDPAWGRNRIMVEVEDNGGRTDATYVDFFVRGDASVEIVNPRSDQIVEPGSDLVIETLSKVNEGPIKDLFLSGIGGERLNTRLKLVSRQGNRYRHQYIWKAVPGDFAYTTLQATLVESSGAITQSNGVGFLVRRKPQITFTNIRTGQVFYKPDKIEISFNTSEISGMAEECSILIDGKNVATVYGNYIWHSPVAGTHSIQIVVRLAGYGPEIGRSEPITIHVK
jgi:hypothetical protein